ncbi:hypothetical protein PISMIDRAFT_466519 [Pisolithus microcarpus 441]|uniref:Uncharacterized protein n=1 Tax=Pisolithus microcarpus 441 TaxID=765257 RepID=A0A0C9ZUC3_9AGAM|nr:hypothetical protein PISMIDRAFT_466519 [Pisolithus microcarpus 441]
MKAVFMETDGMSSGPVLVSQHEQNGVEPLVHPPSSDEELGFTYHQPSGPAASLEQMREAPIREWTTHSDTLSQSAAALPTIPPRSTQAPVETVSLPSCSGEELGSRPLVQQSTFAASPALHPGTSSQSIAPLHTDTPHVPMQAPVEFAVQPSYYGEQSVFSCLQQPGSAAGPGQVWMPYSDVPSDSTLAQLLASSQAPPRLPSEASAQGELAAGSSTSTWLPEPSGPYPMVDISAPPEQAHPQGFHTPHDRYDQHEYCSSTSPASLSYHDIRFDDTYESHRQSWPQRHPSAHLYPHSPSHPRYPTQSPPCQRQPTHSDPPQSQTVLLDPPELARLGLVGRESGLDQHGVSFIRESGFFDG